MYIKPRKKALNTRLTKFDSEKFKSKKQEITNTLKYGRKYL